MINGVWTIETERPAEGENLSASFLPAGIRIELGIAGPTRAAIEQSRRNELGGRVLILPPLPEKICASGLASRICRHGRPVDAYGPFAFNAVFTFFRWTEEDIELPLNEFFVDSGAKVNSQFLVVSIPPLGVDWELWISGNHLMTGFHVATAPTQSRNVAQIWHR
jgi:hypothetical protein